MPDHIIPKLSRYLDNSTNNIVPHTVTFYSIDKKIQVLEHYLPKILTYEIVFRFSSKVCLPVT